MQPAEANEIIAQAARQAQATAAANRTTNADEHQVYASDEEFAPQDDDSKSTSEDFSDTDMEARIASLKDGEKAHLRRITKKGKRQGTSKTTKQANSTAPILKKD